MKRKTIRILHCITDRHIGGAGILLVNLMKHADHTRFIYGIVLPSDSPLLPLLQKTPALLFPMPLHEKSLSFADFLLYAAAIRHFHPDILHTHGSLTARLASAVSSLDGMPFCLFTKHCVFESMRSRRPLLGRVLSYLTSFCTHAVIATAPCAAVLLGKEGVPHSRILTIENGISEMKEPTEKEKDAFLYEIGGHEKLIVGFCGRLEADKNPRLVLSIAKRLSDDDRFLFLFIGDGTQGKKLRERAKKIHLTNVRFIGYRRDACLPQSVLFAALNTSTLSETTNLALLEAAHFGVPMLAADCGGNKTLIRSGENGFLYPRNNADVAAAYLRKMASSPRLYARLQGGAKKTADRHSAKKMATAYEFFYRHLTKK